MKKTTVKKSRLKTSMKKKNKLLRPKREVLV